MKKIYSEIWKLAKPYYEKGRPMDIDHIKWMMKDALLVCKQEILDDALLLPLVILHDVGYAEVPRGNPFKLNLREAHMKAGAIIAKRILNKITYPKDKAKKIIYFVSVHDNWAFGDDDIYKNDILLGVFNDLDYMWMATPRGFPALMKIFDKTPKEMIEYLENDDKPRSRPFSTRTTENLYLKYLDDRKKENRDTQN